MYTCTCQVNYFRVRDHFVPAPSQWQTTLQCNVVSHRLGACTKRFPWTRPKVVVMVTNILPDESYVCHKIHLLTNYPRDEDQYSLRLRWDNFILYFFIFFITMTYTKATTAVVTFVFDCTAFGSNLRGKTSAVGAFLEAIRHIRQNCFQTNFHSQVLDSSCPFHSDNEITKFDAYISTNTRVFIVGIEELFCWRRSTSICVVSD